MSSALTRAISRFDGWRSLVTRIGTGIHRTTFAFQPALRLDDQQLENLFHGDPYASRICRVVPEEALRQGFSVQIGDPDAESGLAAMLDDLRARERVVEAWTWARVWGGGALLVGADDGRDPKEPLAIDAIRSIRFLTVLDKRELAPQDWVTDPLSREYGEPETYLISRTGAVSVDTRVVHASRLIRFDGALASRRRRQIYNSWGESELQRIYDALEQFNGAWAAAATLLQDSSQGVFKIKDLISMIAGDQQDVVRRRLELMDQSRSAARAILLDADSESFERVEANLGALPNTLDKFLLLLSGAAEIPVTILMGQAPAGLNATGDSDVRWFYDRIRAAQTNYLRPRLERLIRLALLAKDGPTGGKEPVGQWSVHFPSLWQPSPQEQATLRKTVADMDVAYIQAGVLTAPEVALSRFRPEGWCEETQIDRDARELAKQLEIEQMTEPPKPPPPQFAAPTPDDPEAGAPPTGAQPLGLTEPPV